MPSREQEKCRSRNGLVFVPIDERAPRCGRMAHEASKAPQPVLATWSWSLAQPALRDAVRPGPAIEARSEGIGWMFGGRWCTTEAVVRHCRQPKGRQPRWAVPKLGLSQAHEQSELRRD
jgi:hypothetical protein